MIDNDNNKEVNNSIDQEAIKIDSFIKVKNGSLYLTNVKRIEVAGVDILPDLLRIIEDHPA